MHKNSICVYNLLITSNMIENAGNHTTALSLTISLIGPLFFSISLSASLIGVGVFGCSSERLLLGVVLALVMLLKWCNPVSMCGGREDCGGWTGVDWDTGGRQEEGDNTPPPKFSVLGDRSKCKGLYGGPPSEPIPREVFTGDILTGVVRRESSCYTTRKFWKGKLE